MTVVAQDGNERELVMLDLDTLPMWLATIDSGRVREDVRPKLAKYQRECARVLRDHFFQRGRDPLVASLESALEVWRAQLALEQKTEMACQLARAALATSHSNFGFFSVLAYARLRGKELTVAEASRHGKKLTAICRKAGLRIGQVRDPRFGLVNVYPESVLRGYFGPEPE
jgi:hypothetical protein